MISSVYVHIPFCRRKCKYCTFASYPELDLIEQYISALIDEIKARYNGQLIKTLYIGGGTPSLLGVTHISKIVSCFKFDAKSEITCEANPENLPLSKLIDLKKAGINRLSFGVQAFDDNLLFLIGRRHSVKDAISSIDNARTAGFENINIDLIYGLPTQTMADFAASVIVACELEVPHISSYGLKIEEGAYFYSHLPENLPDEDAQADMYLKLIQITEKYGYSHYEISNFAKPDFQSIHNLNYWNAENYYGFGCAACGYEQNLRYSHQKSIKKYIENPTFLTEQELLSPQIQLEEKIFLGLRKSEGINISEINEKFNIDFESKYSDILKKYKEYFVNTKNGIAFTNEGFLISNCILSEFTE